MEKLIIVDVAAITRDGLEGKRDGRKLRSPSGHRVMHGLEQQPCGVQVVEWVGLVYLLIRGKPDGSIIGIPEGEGWPAFARRQASRDGVTDLVSSNCLI